MTPPHRVRQIAGHQESCNPMKSETVDAIDVAMAAAGTKATYAGATVSGLGWFLSNEFFGLAGILIGLAGLLITAYFKHKADKRHAMEEKRREAEHLRRQDERDLRMQLMRTSGVPVFHRDTDLGELGADE